VYCIRLLLLLRLLLVLLPLLPLPLLPLLPLSLLLAWRRCRRSRLKMLKRAGEPIIAVRGVRQCSRQLSLHEAAVCTANHRWQIAMVHQQTHWDNDTPDDFDGGWREAWVLTQAHEASEEGE